LFYGWGKKNQALKIPSQEGNYKKTNGLIAINAISGKEYIKMTVTAKAEDVANYFLQLLSDLRREGCNSASIILDNNPSHKDKMRYILWQSLKSIESMIDFKVNFINTPPYSPDYNLAEYAIHQLRVKVLHHCSAKLTLEERETLVQNYLKCNRIFSEAGITNTINHILAL
jgi:transposase